MPYINQMLKWFHISLKPIPRGPAFMIKFAIRQAKSHLNALAQQLACCEESADPDTVHDLRVASRRLDNCLESFRQFFPKRLQKERKRLNSIRKLAKPVRDLDITLELLSNAGVSIESSLAQSLLERRAEAFRELEGCANRWRPGLADRLGAGLRNDGPQKGLPRKTGKKKHRLHLDGVKPAKENAAEVLPPLAKRFFKAGGKVQAATVDAENLHRFRVRVKRFCYTLELFSPCYPELSKYITELQPLQNHLGRMNDCQKALDLLSGDPWARSHPNAAAKLRDTLLTLKTQEVQRFQDCWRESFGKQERDRWIGYLRSPQQKRHLAA
jgi:CHAD domain-containing protein